MLKEHGERGLCALAQEVGGGGADGGGRVEDLAVAEMVDGLQPGGLAGGRHRIGVADGNVGVVAGLQQEGGSAGLGEQLLAREVRDPAMRNALQAALVGAARGR